MDEPRPTATVIALKAAPGAEKHDRELALLAEVSACVRDAIADFLADRPADGEIRVAQAARCLGLVHDGEVV